MKITPVETITAPKYPDKYGDAARRTLASARPMRWLGTPLMAGVLSASVVLGAGGCDANPASPNISAIPGSTYNPALTGDPGPTGPVSSDITDYVLGGAPMPYPDVTWDPATTYDAEPTSTWFNPDAIMIPLFEYGEGTGVIGCEVVAAPVFLSEEEAFEILSAYFADAGLTLRRDAITLENANVPLIEPTAYTSDEKYKTVPGSLASDGFLGRQSLPVVFVSKGDIDAWTDRDTGVWSSVEAYSPRLAAKTLAEGNKYLAVFYDPLATVDINSPKLRIERMDGESDDDYWARWQIAYEEANQDAREESERLLGLQAEAFIAWLRSVGMC
jgi:hypothetical protein